MLWGVLERSVASLLFFKSINVFAAITILSCHCTTFKAWVLRIFRTTRVALLVLISLKLVI